VPFGANPFHLTGLHHGLNGIAHPWPMDVDPSYGMILPAGGTHGAREAPEIVVEMHQPLILYEHFRHRMGIGAEPGGPLMVSIRCCSWSLRMGVWSCKMLRFTVAEVPITMTPRG
jgi:hypothetical protein